MPKFCVRITEQMPSEECLVEADSENDALNIRQRDLQDWADLVGLRVDPVDETAANPCEKKPRAGKAAR